MENCYANWPLVLEYLKVLLAWPPLVVGALLLALFRFRTELAALIGRVQSLKGFGAEVSTPLAAAQNSATALPPGSEIPSENMPGSRPGTVAGATRPPQQSANSIDAISADPVRARQEILRWWGAARFEMVVNRAFGTQLRLLMHLAQMSVTGETFSNLEPFHLEHQQLATAAGVTPAPLANFYAFLTQMELIRSEGTGAERKVMITQMGLDFLQYFTNNYGAQWHKPW